ncbi:chemotaxis protein CheW [Anaeromyxobacter oryzisoli]|uniref:chemotaxis protein CheW n=1 Tax=Anaeromyxobacter oryzisoli TaxID=2925408 RepID=UPI001F587AC4|nr:chemotaxis protein CheW [Anaeromyxobacter sp. SG63]
MAELASEAAATRPGERTGDAPARHVVFRVAGERYALPLEAVREVVPPQPPFARVPRASEAVRGVMNLRGRVVAVVDLAALVGLAPQPLAEGVGHVVILDQDRRTLGFLVGAVAGVEPLAPPAEGGAGLVRGVTAARAGAVTVLGAAALMDAAVALFGGR